MPAPRGSEVWRDFASDGIPSSGPHEPKKPQIRSWTAWLESLVTSGVLSSGPWFATREAMTLGYAANTIAVVYDDTTASENGLYIKVGASGSGSWTQLTTFLPGYQFVTASPTGESTANAIVATTSPRLPAGDGVALVSLPIPQTNTSSAVTVAFDDGPDLTIKTRNGENPGIGELQAGDVISGFVSGATFRLIVDPNSLIHAQRAEAAQAASEAARDIAAGYVSDAVSQGNVPIYATAVGMAALEVPVGISAFRVNGHDAIGDDGRDALYIDADNGTPVAITTGGATARGWYLSASKVTPAMFGARRGRSNASGNVAAFNAMFAYCAQTGAEFDLLGGSWFINDTLEITHALTGYGRGLGYWHIDPAVQANEENKLAQTQIILTGTGPKSISVHGISSMKASGGMVANPSARAGFNESHYSLLSLSEPISAGLYIRSTADGTDLSGFRILPDGGGDDGLDLYNDAAATGATPWAADWDVGILVEATARLSLDLIQSVGHFRKGGLGILSIPADPVDQFPPVPMGLSITRSHFEGYKPVFIRGSDQFRIKAVGADWIDIPYADDHPFDPAVHDEIGLSKNSFSATGRTFTGVSQTDPNTLRLTGVSSTSGFVAGDAVIARHIGGGTSHINFSDVQMVGMKHPSGYVCHDQRLGANAMPYPGNIGPEISGWRATEITFDELCRVQGREQVLFHVHDCHRTNFDFQREANADQDNSKMARPIASPALVNNNRVPYPAGRTNVLLLGGKANYINDTASGFDLRPWAENGSSFFTAVGDDGLLDADYLLMPAYAVKDSIHSNVGMKAPKGRYVAFFRSNDDLVFGYDDVNDRMETRKHIVPNQSGARDFGDETHIWRAAHVRSLKVYPQVAEAPTTNGQMTFQAESNTSLRIRYRGTDGVTRSTLLTLS